jgi:disulfide bond formation protein DsbB
MKKLPFLELAWIQAAVAMLGSLYFSDIAGYPPCHLCWYQRIAMYPLVAILAVGIWRKDKGVHLYALPLALIGLFISFYHNVLYIMAKYAPEGTIVCTTTGYSCTAKYIEWFGFITIPLLAFVAFAIIIALLTLHARQEKMAAKK